MENLQYKHYFRSQSHFFFFNSERLPELLEMQYHVCKYSLVEHTHTHTPPPYLAIGRPGF